MTNKKQEEIKNNKKQETKEVKKDIKPKTEIKKVDIKSELKKSKGENKKLNEQIRNLINQVNELKLTNETSIASFQEKAKSFQTKAQEEIDKVKEQLKIKSEHDNKEFKQYAMQKTFENIIDPLINIEMAINSGKEQSSEVQGYVMGFEMLMNQILVELENSGLKKIEPKIGDEFDPELHQVISKEDGNENKIIAIKKPGFKLNDRVLKPSIVVIGK